MPLSDRDRAILEFEGAWRRHAGAKEEAIRRDLAMSPARYYQLLGRLVDTADAQEHDPMLVKRLRRLREARLDARVRAAGSAPRLDTAWPAGTGAPTSGG